MKNKYLVTAALPYANGPLHIGHLAGAYLSSDVFVRYLRLMGKDVVFVCGSDEHGAAITMRALKEETTPQAIVDKYHALIKKTFERIGVDFDIYHRTSDPLHHETSQDFFRTLLKNGEFTEETTEQLYDEQAGQFLADRYIIGTCPNCQNPDAYGDQCEKCGTSLSPTELIDPKSTLTGAKPVLKKTTHWFLRLDKHEAWLKEWINTGKLNGAQLHDPKDWKNHVLGQCNSWLEQGLQPRAMTRDLDWGVDVPQEIEGSLGKKLYVWLDAPIGYISATKQWAADNGKKWEDYWKSEDSELVHFIGKDNIVFHCVIFPAILKAHGGYVLPTNVPANQFMNLEGRKLSTSKNWAVWVHEYLDDLPNQEDALRYNLIKNMPEQKDSEFTWKLFQETNDTELVNNLANFVHRVLVLTHKFFEGQVPDYQANAMIQSGFQAGNAVPCEAELAFLKEKTESVGAEIMRYNFREALKNLMEISSAGNQLLQVNEPWKAIKTNPELVAAVLNMGLQIVATLSVAMQPFLPFATARLRQMLNLPALKNKGDLAELLNTLAQGTPVIAAGTQLEKAEHLFSRIADEVIQAQVEKLENAAKANKGIEYAPLKPTIQYDDFAKLDIRTGTILTAEKVKKADKLLQLTVDLGFEQRTIVSGIAQHFSPEEVVGQRVLVLANLAPRKLRGIESQGMILMAEDAEGKLGFVQTAAEWVNGFGVS